MQATVHGERERAPSHQLFKPIVSCPQSEPTDEASLAIKDKKERKGEERKGGKTHARTTRRSWTAYKIFDIHRLIEARI